MHRLDHAPIWQRIEGGNGVMPSDDWDWRLLKNSWRQILEIGCCASDYYTRGGRRLKIRPLLCAALSSHPCRGLLATLWNVLDLKTLVTFHMMPYVFPLKLYVHELPIHRPGLIFVGWRHDALGLKKCCCGGFKFNIPYYMPMQFNKC